jgi:hypothetical protein
MLHTYLEEKFSRRNIAYKVKCYYKIKKKILLAKKTVDGAINRPKYNDTAL